MPSVTELVRSLNTDYGRSYESPPAGILNPPAAGRSPFTSLTEGARTLICIADTFHDFSHIKNIQGVPQTRPGSTLLKSWAQYIITLKGLPPLDLTVFNTIYTYAEDFVLEYMYYNDKIFYTNSQYATGINLQQSPILPIWNNLPNIGKHGQKAHGGTDPYHFIVLSYPLQGFSGKNPRPTGIQYSRDSASLLYNIQNTIYLNNPNWSMTNNVVNDQPDYENYNTTFTDSNSRLYNSLWYSRDQLAPNKIFNDYDVNKQNITTGDKTNWYMWVGLAAQYDRDDMIDADKCGKLFCKPQGHQQDCDFQGATVQQLEVSLEDDEAVFGIQNITLRADTFSWNARNQVGAAAAQAAAQGVAAQGIISVNYDIPARRNLKRYLALALGHARDSNDLKSLFSLIFTYSQQFAAMFDTELFKDLGIVNKTATGVITSINFTAVANLFPNPQRRNNYYDAISLFTDFKRIGDYLQAKEIYILEYLKDMRIPLLTHDAILAAISHKIFNNHKI